MFKKSNYPSHPENIVINKKDSITGSIYQEKDVFNYYDGIKAEIIPILKGKNLFIRLKTNSGAIYIRHPFFGDSEFIRINDEMTFSKYNNGRVIEFHTTMGTTTDMWVVDFDAVGDWKKTKEITAEIADGLEKLSIGHKVQIRYTGKRGFHIILFLKKPQSIDKARENLKAWLKETFKDRDDLIIGESPKGNKGALGVSPMKLNGGQIALWSLRITGLCCVEVPRSKLFSFEKEEATLKKTYKKLTGKDFITIEKKVMARRIVKNYTKKTDQLYRVVKAFLQEKESFLWTQPKKTERLQTRFQQKPGPRIQEEKEFAEPGEMVEVLENGKWVKKPYNKSMENKKIRELVK